MQSMIAQRSARILFAAMIIAASLFVVLQVGRGQQTASAATTSAKMHWTPVNHQKEDQYWQQRIGNVTSQEFAAARAQSAKLPKATQLPHSNHSAKQPQSNANPGWTPIGPVPINVYGVTTYAGRVSALAIDPTTSGASTVIYLGAADGGVWKSTNNGQSWTSLTDSQQSLATGAIAIDPTNHNIIYVGTGEPNQSADSYFGDGILKSTNGGSTWTLLGQSTFGTRTGAITGIVVNPNNNQQIFASSTNGIYISTNGGTSWSATSVTGIVDSLSAYTSANPITLYATVRYAGMYRSTDGGTTWTLLSGGLPSSSNWNRSVVAAAPSNPNVVYTVINDANSNVYVSGTYNGGYYSTNGGTTWSQMTSLNQNFTCDSYGCQGWYDLYLAVDPKNDQIVYGGGIDVAVTANARGAGGNWQNITDVYGYDNSNIHPDQHAIAFPACSSAPCPAYLGNDGGIYTSNNTTSTPQTSVTYTDLNTPGLAITEFTGGDVGPHFASNPLALGGTQDNGTMRYTGNAIWNEVQGGDGGFAAIDQTNPNVMYAEYTGPSLQKSTDGGNSWNDGTGGGTLSGSSLFYMPYVLDRSNDQHLVAGTNAVYETINGTTSWYQSSQGFGVYPVSAVAVAPGNSKVIYAGLTDGELFRTTNGESGSQSAFTALASLNPHYITSITVDPHDATGNTAYVTTGIFYAGDPGYIWKTTNGGASWTNISGSLPNYPINSVVEYYSGSTPVLVIGTDLGVFYTADNGTTWNALNNGLPNVVVSQLALNANDSTLVAYTHGRSAWKINIPSLVPSPTTVGIFRTSNAMFYLKNSNTAGPADITFPYGTAGDVPVVGDWIGQGFDTVGIFRNGTFYLKNTNAAGPADIAFSYGTTGDIPIAGDWTGKGYDSVGIYRNGVFYLKNSNTPGGADSVFPYGASGDIPIVGDWTGQGFDTVGVYRPSTGMFYLRNSNTAGPADISFPYGTISDKPITGDWIGQGKTTMGIYRPSVAVFFLRNSNTSGPADNTFPYGSPSDVAIAGTWK